jgi:hypothetical protein
MAYTSEHGPGFHIKVPIFNAFRSIRRRAEINVIPQKLKKRAYAEEFWGKQKGDTLQQKPASPPHKYALT